jgi:hypothetical protein
VALVRTDVSEKPGGFFIRVTKIGELGTTHAGVVPSSPIFATLMKEAPGSSETSVLTTATRRNSPEETILYRKFIGRAMAGFHSRWKQDFCMSSSSTPFLGLNPIPVQLISGGLSSRVKRPGL